MTAVAAPPRSTTGTTGTTGTTQDDRSGSATKIAHAAAKPGAGRRPWVRGLLGAAVAAVLVGEGLVIAPTVSPAVDRLTAADPGWIAVAVAAAAVSMSFFARTRRRLLAAAGVRVRHRDAVAAVYVANALHATLPGGAAFSTAWTYRWMRSRGAGGPAVAWTLVAGGVLSASTLGALALTGSLLAGQGTGVGHLTLDVGVIALLGAGLTVVRRRPDRLLGPALRVAAGIDRVLRRPPGRSSHALKQLVAQVAVVRPRGADWSAAALFAAANWAFDAGCLAACAAAVGAPGLSGSSLLLAYTAGMAASSLSILPAGIGMVDGAMVLALTASGLPAATALPVVLLYRLISLGGVVAAGWCIAALQSRAVVAKSLAVAGC